MGYYFTGMLYLLFVKVEVDRRGALRAGAWAGLGKILYMAGTKFWLVRRENDEGGTIDACHGVDSTVKCWDQ